MDTSAEKPASSRSVALRALSLLDTFDRGREQQTLSDMARRAGMPVGTAHRLAGDLVAWGGLERHGTHYSIGQRVWQLGHLAVMQSSIAEIAAPYMQDVLFVTQNVVNFFIQDSPDRDDVLLVERLSGTLVKAPFRRAGERVSYHGSAGGKVLLAHAEETVVQRVLRAPTRFTEHTLTDPQAVRSEIDRVRSQGFAESRQETAVDHYGIAVPVTRTDGRVVGAIGVVTLGKPAPVGSVVPVLRIAARGIARQWGLRALDVRAAGRS